MVEEEFEGEEEDTLNLERLSDPHVALSLFLIVIFAMSLFYPYKPDEKIEIGGLTLIIGFFLLLTLASKPIIQYAKYRTGMLTADGIHGSTWGEPVVKGGIYEAYSLGDCRLGVLNFRGRECTVIGPSHAFRHVGKHVNTAAWVEKIEPDQIPLSIRELVIKSNSCPRPYWRVWYDSRLEGKVEKLDYLRNENKMLNQIIALQERKIRSLMQSTEEMEQWKRRVVAPILEAREEKLREKIKSKLLGG